jgi:hypothetical protein
MRFPALAITWIDGYAVTIAALPNLAGRSPATHFAACRASVFITLLE